MLQVIDASLDTVLKRRAVSDAERDGCACAHSYCVCVLRICCQPGACAARYVRTYPLYVAAALCSVTHRWVCEFRTCTRHVASERSGLTKQRCCASITVTHSIVTVSHHGKA
jgi:hypothetical protein